MQEYFSVQEAAEIINMDKETIRRYIREALMTDEQLQAAQEKATKLGKAYKTHFAINNDIENIRNQDGLLALCVKNPNTKSYLITKDSLELLLTRKLKSKEAAEAALVSFIRNKLPQEDAKRREAQSCFIIPAINSLNKVFLSNSSKEKFIKGLYLVQFIDNKFPFAEQAFINDRAERLGLPHSTVAVLVPDPKNMDIEPTVAELVFENMPQAIAFLIEALNLSWQDSIFKQCELNIIEQIASNNGLDKLSFDKLVNDARAICVETITKSLVSN